MKNILESYGSWEMTGEEVFVRFKEWNEKRREKI